MSPSVFCSRVFVSLLFPESPDVSRDEVEGNIRLEIYEVLYCSFKESKSWHLFFHFVLQKAARLLPSTVKFYRSCL